MISLLNVCFWLFAVSTGARSISCENIQIGDIVQVMRREQSIFVKVKIRVTKGSESDDHVVTIEGDNNEKDPSDIIYWLRMSLRLYHDLDLFNLQNLPPSVLAKPLFGGLSRDSMRERIKIRCLQAGYPSGRFGFHSLRSGFMCSALLEIAQNPEPRDSILETTAWVGNWTVGSRAQLSYVKKCAKAAIVSTRLVKGAATLSDPALCEPGAFHNITFETSVVYEPPKTRLFFARHLRTLFERRYGQVEKNQRMKTLATLEK